MPKINALTSTGKVQQEVLKLSRETKHSMIDNKISATQIARVLDMTPQAVSTQFRQGHISIDVYVTAQMLLNGEL